MPPGSPEDKPQAVCRHFQKGYCRFAVNCKFLHEVGLGNTFQDELQDERGVTATTAASSSADTSSRAQNTMRSSENAVKSVKWMNKPCRNWKTGNCRWGDKCHFQHEIKIPQENSDTKLNDVASPEQDIPAINDITSPMASDPSTSSGRKARKRRRKGKNTGSRDPQLLRAPQANAEEETLLNAGEQAEVTQLKKEREEDTRTEGEKTAQALEEAVRRAQKEAVRRAPEETLLRIEATLRHREDIARGEREETAVYREGGKAVRQAQEVARLADERDLAARDEQQLQLATEREEERERERERQAHRRKQEEEWTKEATTTIQQVIFSSFVKFEAGLSIQHVICGFEASRVLVKNLPMSAKPSEILALFAQQGIVEEDLAILRIENVGDCQQATVLGKAAEVEVVAVGLDTIEFHDNYLEFVVCEHFSQGRTMSSSNRDSYHLTISWRPSLLTMLAHYPHLAALEVVRKAQDLDDQVLNGQRVKAELHSNQHIKIYNIPEGTSVEMVKTFAGTQQVEIYQEPISSTSNDVLSVVDQHIRSLPYSTLQTFSLENTSQSNSVSAKAIFNTWDGAKAARDSLDGKILRPNFPALDLSLSDPYCFTITINEKQYNAQKSQWEELCGGKGKDVTLQTKAVGKAGEKKVSVGLSGSDKKVVGALKVRIESLATGQKLDAAHWHPTFKTRKGRVFINGLYETTGTYAHYDRRNHCVTVFGNPEAVENAKSRVKEEVERITSEEWTIPLQRRTLGFFIRRGLAQMKDLLGAENVTLDVANAQIVLHGADLEEARHHLNQLMDAFTEHESGSTATDDAPCPICYDTVSQPIETGCEHIYCSSCLRHYILSTLDNHNFPLKCMGNDATCNQPFSIPLIKKFLPPKRFEQLLEAAFCSYIDKNPQTFKSCNTPDCSQVYRITTGTELQVLQCPSCFSEICTACGDEGHTGMTCVEKRQHRNLEEQERLLEAWVTENNVKKCPSCRAWVEKAAGCNHMSCKCGAHFCWICSGVFDRGRIYDHMTQAHGDWYNNPEHNQRQAAVAGQAMERIPNIIEIAGGQAAVAEQAAELRRFELLREGYYGEVVYA